MASLMSEWKLLSTWRRGVDIKWIADSMKQFLMFELLKSWHQWNWESSFITVHVRQVQWVDQNCQYKRNAQFQVWLFFVGHVSKNRWSKCIQHRKSHCFFQTSLKRFAAGPLVLQYMQNTIEPSNKAIIFVPKRTCLFLGTMDVDCSRLPIVK